MNQEKKLITIFRTFIEKSLVPQIRKNEGNLQDWNRLNNLLTTEPLNYN